MFAGRHCRCTSSAAPAAYRHSCFRAACLHMPATFLWIYTQQTQFSGSRNNPRNKVREQALIVAVQPALPVRPMPSAESVTMKLQISRSRTGPTTGATKQAESYILNSAAERRTRKFILQESNSTFIFRLFLPLSNC